ncbi:MAG: hypothetical protein ACOY3I_04070 [Verrucomicrobiota bacterium]
MHSYDVLSSSFALFTWQALRKIERMEHPVMGEYYWKLAQLSLRDTPTNDASCSQKEFDEFRDDYRAVRDRIRRQYGVKVFRRNFDHESFSTPKRQEPRYHALALNGIADIYRGLETCQESFIRHYIKRIFLRDDATAIFIGGFVNNAILKGMGLSILREDVLSVFHHEKGHLYFQDDGQSWNKYSYRGDQWGEATNFLQRGFPTRLATQNANEHNSELDKIDHDPEVCRWMTQRFSAIRNALSKHRELYARANELAAHS